MSSEASAAAEYSPRMPSTEPALGLESDLRDLFAVHDIYTRNRGQVLVFVGQFLRSPDLVFSSVADRFRARGYTPMLQRDEGRDLLLAIPSPLAANPARPWRNLALLALTIGSTLMAGAFQALPSSLEVGTAGQLAHALLANWKLGVPFAAALLGILGVHELGHYFVARHYRLDVTLPYFIPFPFNPYTGTLGAVIRIRSPFQSRKALFDVGIAGPLAGLAIAVPVVALGLQRAVMVSLPDTGVTLFREPLLFQWMALAIRGPRQPGVDFLMNPLLAAGWWGFFITALNLLPISQLDGGHVSYAVFGSRHRLVAWGAFAVAAAVAIVVNPGYLLMLVLVLAMGLEHPPALDGISPIGRGRRVLGLIALLLCLLLITPDPLSIG